MITFSSLRAIKEYPTILLRDIKSFCNDDYYYENYDKHFKDSFFINVVILGLLFGLDKLDETSYFLIIFLSWFSSFFYNGVREWYLGFGKDAPFSWGDIRFGGYGGLIAGVVCVLTLIIYKCLY